MYVPYAGPFLKDVIEMKKIPKSDFFSFSPALASGLHGGFKNSTNAWTLWSRESDTLNLGLSDLGCLSLFLLLLFFLMLSKLFLARTERHCSKVRSSNISWCLLWRIHCGFFHICSLLTL